jgi:hypothetical protein
MLRLSCLESGNAVEGEAGRANEGCFVRQDGHCSEVEKAFLCDQGALPQITDVLRGVPCMRTGGRHLAFAKIFFFAKEGWSRSLDRVEGAGSSNCRCRQTVTKGVGALVRGMSSDGNTSSRSHRR